MISVDINFTADDLAKMFMFEPKDHITLSSIERLMQRKYPGNYRFVKFVDPDMTGGDLVLLINTEFDSEEDRVLFMMRWE